MADPDLRIRGVGAVIQTLFKGGLVANKIFSCLKIRGSPEGLGPSPGSAAVKVQHFAYKQGWLQSG